MEKTLHVKLLRSIWLLLEYFEQVSILQCQKASSEKKNHWSKLTKSIVCKFEILIRKYYPNIQERKRFKLLIFRLNLYNILLVCSVAHSYPTLCDPIDCSLPGSPVCGILHTRILDWIAMPSSSYVSCFGRQVLYH